MQLWSANRLSVNQSIFQLYIFFMSLKDCYIQMKDSETLKLGTQVSTILPYMDFGNSSSVLIDLRSMHAYNLKIYQHAWGRVWGRRLFYFLGKVIHLLSDGLYNWTQFLRYSLQTDETRSKISYSKFHDYTLAYIFLYTLGVSNRAKITYKI